MQTVAIEQLKDMMHPMSKVGDASDLSRSAASLILSYNARDLFKVSETLSIELPSMGLKIVGLKFCYFALGHLPPKHVLRHETRRMACGYSEQAAEI